MNREDSMDAFIAEAKKAATLFVNMLHGKCPELLTKKEVAYIHSDMLRNVEVYFDEALERAKEADEPSAYSHEQEEHDRERMRA